MTVSIRHDAYRAMNVVVERRGRPSSMLTTALPFDYRDGQGTHN